MADQIALTLELIDRATGPAKRVQRATSGLTDHFDGLNRTFRPMQSGMLSGLASSVALAGGIGIAATAAMSAAKAMVELGAKAALAIGSAAIDAAEFGQSMRKSLGMISRTGEIGGGREFDAIRKLAAQLGLEVRATTEQYRELRAMQFSIAKATDIVKLGADMSALGADAAKVESTIRAITQIKGKGRLQMEELQQQLAEAGIATEMVVRELAKMRNVAPDAIRKMISAGKIGADEGVEAIQRAVMQKLNIKELGQAGKAMATTTIKGMRSRLVGAWDNLILDMGAKVEPALNKLAPIFEDIISALESPAAMKAIEVVSETIDGLVNTVKAAWPVVKEFASGFGEGFSEGWDAVLKAFREFDKAAGSDTQETMRNLAMVARAAGFALGHMVAMTAALVAGIGKLEAASKSAFEPLNKIATLQTQVGNAIGFGMGKGPPVAGASSWGIIGDLLSQRRAQSEPAMLSSSASLIDRLGLRQGAAMPAPASGATTNNNSLAVSVSGVGKNEQEIAQIVRRECERLIKQNLAGAKA